MPARLVYHVPGEPALTHTLTSGCLLGRASDCDIVLAHTSVSRQHARIEPSTLGWLLHDLGSKNGIRVEGMKTTSWSLLHGQWFALGDVYVKFEEVSDEAVTAAAAQAELRRSDSQSIRAKIGTEAGIERLIADLLAAFVHLADARRGFLLAGGATGQLRVRAGYGLTPEDVGDSGFEGSLGAVERAMQLRRAVYLSDPSDATWLKKRASVVGGGLRALVCLPLEDEGRLLGALYADSDDAARVFTELDAEILNSFARHASLLLASEGISGDLDRLGDWLAVGNDGAIRVFDEPPEWASLRSRGLGPMPGIE